MVSCSSPALCSKMPIPVKENNRPARSDDYDCLIWCGVGMVAIPILGSLGLVLTIVGAVYLIPAMYIVGPLLMGVPLLIFSLYFGIICTGCCGFCK